MARISAKQLRTIDQHLRALISPKGVEPDSWEATKRLGLNFLRHELRLSNGRSFLMTDQGLRAYESIAAIFREANLVPHTEGADAVNVLRRVLQDLLSEGKQPDDAAELVKLVTERLEQMRDVHWYVVPVHGLELKGIETIDLGCLHLERATEANLSRHGADLSGSPRDADEELGAQLCLIGSAFGSAMHAEREFKLRVDAVIGVLSAVAAACFQQGAVPFRLTAETSPYGARTASRGIHWRDAKPMIGWSRGFGEHQTLPINEELAEFLQTAGYVRHALCLAQRADLSPLEESLLRGFFWFSDAQRDNVRVMQLVKFWSCAEVIFTGDGEGITRRVSEGVAGVLVAGTQIEPPERYGEIVKRLTSLYGKRSKAVHSARHDHVTYEDVAVLSRWTGWMLLGVAGLIAEMGYTRSAEVREQCERIAGIMRRSKARGAAPQGPETHWGPDPVKDI